MVLRKQTKVSNETGLGLLERARTGRRERRWTRRREEEGGREVAAGWAAHRGCAVGEGGCGSRRQGTGKGDRGCEPMKQRRSRGVFFDWCLAEGGNGSTGLRGGGGFEEW